ncbi:hypothetical protein PRIPAC_76334 [Pristionchus pacificus]|uniref:Uncharacterized protein n=1 Tax=Pristionchus pacificus TaxID=54126 RepID=A0A2A6CSI1_PRIPA|nr:hypothetical protein PRIPAC_76334 [Pristionchus pacificus]|eukprot:PDM81080.1 hypothetical protein PRIPAC_36083 [Pristionchus pacificus]
MDGKMDGGRMNSRVGREEEGTFRIDPEGKIVVAGEKIVKKNGRVISHQKAVYQFEKNTVPSHS